MARSNIHLGVSGSRRQPEQMVEIIIPRQSSGKPQATCLDFSQWTAYKAGIRSMWRQLPGPGGAGGGGVEEGSRRLLTGHAVTLAVRKHRLSQGAKTKARERFLVIQTQFSAYRLQDIICLATAQRAETLCYLISLFLLAVSIRNVRRNPWCGKRPMQISKGGRAELPCDFPNETRRQGWRWWLSSLVQMSPVFMFRSWHARRCFAHWSSLPVWITVPLLWAETLAATVCLIRGELSLAIFWRLQGIWRKSLKILHLTRWMVLKIITPALQLPTSSLSSQPSRV